MCERERVSHIEHAPRLGIPPLANQQRLQIPAPPAKTRHAVPHGERARAVRPVPAVAAQERVARRGRPGARGRVDAHAAALDAVPAPARRVVGVALARRLHLLQVRLRARAPPALPQRRLQPPPRRRARAQRARREVLRVPLCSGYEERREDLVAQLLRQRVEPRAQRVWRWRRRPRERVVGELRLAGADAAAVARL